MIKSLKPNTRLSENRKRESKKGDRARYISFDEACAKFNLMLN
ncbi:MAG: hypothetical protein ACJAWA_000279 [Nonlabens sp.]|jgi:hypothetical protein